MQIKINIKQFPSYSYNRSVPLARRHLGDVLLEKGSSTPFLQSGI